MTDVEVDPVWMARPPPPAKLVGESRWPMTIAVVVLMGAALVAPPHLSIFPGWLLASARASCSSRSSDRRSGQDRPSDALAAPHDQRALVILLASTLGWTVLLVTDLLTSSPVTDEPGPLLVAGAKVWLGNNVAFALLYWAFDCGGPAARAHGMPPVPRPGLPATDEPGPRARPAGARSSSTTCTSRSPRPTRSARRTRCRWSRGPRSRWVPRP